MSSKDLEILIATTADLSGAEAAGEQLERDTADARALATACADAAAQLQKLREALAAFPTHATASVAPTEPASSSAPPPGLAPAEALRDSDSSPAAAQAIRSAAEKLSAALEQNTRLTLALLNQTIDAVQQQNQSLSAMDRRLAGLAGQIENLKNNH